MTADIVVPATGVVLSALAVAGVVFASRFLFLGLNPWRGLTVKQREKLMSGQSIYRYLSRSMYVDHEDGTVTVTANSPCMITRAFGHPPRGPRMCFYVGHSRRGAWLNWSSVKHQSQFGAHDVVIVEAADFLAAYEGKVMRLRSWDRAVVVGGHYSGPAVIKRDVEHSAARLNPVPPERS